MQFGKNIVTRDLVFYIDAANKKSYTGSGTLTSEMISDLEGTLVNGVSFGSNNSGVFSFDGTNDYIDIPSFNFGVGEFTLSCWIFHTRAATNVADGIISKSASGKREFFLRINSAGSDEGLFLWKSDSGAGAGNQFATAVTIPQNQWQNIVVTINSTNVEFYINGLNVKSYSGSYTLFNGDAPFRIANWVENASYGYDFQGDISNISYYTRALSSVEVLQNYNALKDRFI